MTKPAQLEKDAGPLLEWLRGIDAPRLMRVALGPSPMAEPVLGTTVASIRNLGIKSGVTPALQSLKGKADSAIYKHLVDREAKKSLEEYVSSMRKQSADVGFMPVPTSLMDEVRRGDPSATAELKSLEEAHTRQMFAGRHGLLPSFKGRSLLGRVRDPHGTLSSREEELLKKHPEMRWLAAAAQPNKTYPGSRFLTNPAVAAIPSAGIGALLGNAIARMTGSEGLTSQLATGGGAALGGVLGSAISHAGRQRHARKLNRTLGEWDRIEREISHQEKGAGVLGQVLTDVIDVPRPHPGIPNGTGPSMGTMSPYRAPNAAAIISQIRSRRGKMASLADILPHFLETLTLIKS